MTLQEKKKIAEWMGWSVRPIPPEFLDSEIDLQYQRAYAVYYDYHDDSSWTKKCNLEYYNPDTDLAQFLEVLSNLTKPQRETIVIKIWKEIKYVFNDEIESCIWLTDPKNMPKVMKAVREVILT